MSFSLHARKWASIHQRGSLSAASKQTISGEDQEITDLGHDNSILQETSEGTVPIMIDEKVIDTAVIDTAGESEYELSSRSHRKHSHGVSDATKLIGDFVAGVSGFDIFDDDAVSFQNEVSYNTPLIEEDPTTEDSTTSGFRRRDTRRLVGPGGEKIVSGPKGTLTRDGGSTKCMLEIAADDQMMGFVERVLEGDCSRTSSTDMDGSPADKINGFPDLEISQVRSGTLTSPVSSLAVVTSSGVITSSLSDRASNRIGHPLLTSSMLKAEKEAEAEGESLDLSSEEDEEDEEESEEERMQRHMSFSSTDLPLYPTSRVAPIPRVQDLQREGNSGGVPDDFTTTDTEDMYSSHNSSGGDAIGSLLPPIHTQFVRRAPEHGNQVLEDQPDFEELERYFPNHNMTVFVGTWNMHSEKDVPLLVEEFLMPGQCEFLQDVYVVGTQECTPHKREWEVTVQATLGPTHVLIRSESLGDIHLIVLVRREMIWIIRDVQSCTVACGAGGVMRNKGAVGIILTVFGSSMLFITAHLRAHASKVKERNLDSLRIATSLDFSRYSVKPLNGEKDDIQLDCTDKVDNVFWFGDLNYRVTCDRDVAETAILSNDLQPLIREDQLLQQMRERQAFRGFTEADITFPPTFKFDPGTPDYDTSTKQRVPSWTDRVLYKSKQDAISPQIYDYCPSITHSDHRPVFGVYGVTLKPSPLSSTMRATGWFDKRAYARGMKRRQLYPKIRHSMNSDASSPKKDRSKVRQQSFVMKAVNVPVKKVMTNHRTSTVCSVM